MGQGIQLDNYSQIVSYCQKTVAFMDSDGALLDLQLRLIRSLKKLFEYSNIDYFSSNSHNLQVLVTTLVATEFRQFCNTCDATGIAITSYRCSTHFDAYCSPCGNGM